MRHPTSQQGEGGAGHGGGDEWPLQGSPETPQAGVTSTGLSMTLSPVALEWRVRGTWDTIVRRRRHVQT